MNDTKRLSGINIGDRVVSNRGKVDEVKDFLNQHYEIRMNVFDSSKAEIRCKTDYYKSENQITVNEISLHAINEGISVGDSIIKKILNSPHYTKTFNPIHEYFDTIGKAYKGKSHIDLLCQHLKARDFGDKEENFYQDRLVYLVKKFLVATIACAYGKQENDVALGFVESDGGIGKTFLLNYLVPDKLKDFYIVSDPDLAKFSLRQEITRNLFINFEELQGVNPRNIEDFKLVLSSRFSDLRTGNFMSRFARMGSVVFSSNKTAEKGGFLHTQYGSRRWAIIELSEIDHNYSNVVDVDQIWAEAATLLAGNYQYKWNMDDINAFKEYNKRYLVITPAMQTIDLYYEPGFDDEADTRWLQPSEILTELVRLKRLTSDVRAEITAEKVGEALRNLKFERRSVRRDKPYAEYCYCVKNKI